MAYWGKDLTHYLTVVSTTFPGLFLWRWYVLHLKPSPVMWLVSLSLHPRNNIVDTAYILLSLSELLTAASAPSEKVSSHHQYSFFLWYGLCFCKAPLEWITGSRAPICTKVWEELISTCQPPPFLLPLDAQIPHSFFKSKRFVLQVTLGIVFSDFILFPRYLANFSF